MTSDPENASAKGCKTDPAMSGPPNITMQIECDGTSTDSGRLHVRVKALAPSDTCQTYRLTVFAE